MFKEKLRTVVASRVFYVIFSILAACALWFFLAISENPDVTNDYSGITIQYSGQDALENRDLIITDIDYSKLNLRLSGKRLDIAKINSSDIIVTVDMSGITSAGTHLLQYTVDYDAKVNKSEITVVRATTDYITVTVKKLVTKSINVRGTYDGDIDEGYVGGTLLYTPSTIEISGPEDEVSQVDYAWVVLTRDSISKTVTDNLPFTLMDSNATAVVSENITANVTTIEVTQEVSTVKDVPLDINIIEGAGATAENTIIEISPAVITLSGDADVMESINKITLGTVDLTSFQTSYTEEMRIVVPNDVINSSGVSTATVTVRVVGLETTRISASNIQVINETDGYTTDIITQSVDISLRGPASDIGAIKAENIRIVASLEEIGNSEGIFDVEAKVYVDGYPNVGAVGTYKVNVRITKS